MDRVEQDIIERSAHGSDTEDQQARYDNLDEARRSLN